jgi:hypothetical protein
MLMSPILARGQELVPYAHPFHAHHLAGVVLDWSGAPVSGVTVEVSDRPFMPSNGEASHVLASAKTDKNGHFAFPNLNLRTTRYLHLSLPGFDPAEVGVKHRLFAPQELRIKLHIAA